MHYFCGVLIMECMILYLEIMGWVEKVHFVKLPSPFQNLFSLVSSLYFIKWWENALTLIKTGLFGDILFFIVPDIGGGMFVLIYFWSIMHLVGH